MITGAECATVIVKHMTENKIFEPAMGLKLADAIGGAVAEILNQKISLVYNTHTHPIGTPSTGVPGMLM